MGKVGCDRVHIRLRLLDSNAGLETAHGQQPVKVVIQLVGFKGQGHDEPLVLAVNDSGSQDANDRVRVSVDLDLLSDNVGIGAQALPHLVDKDYDPLFSHYSFFGKKVAAKLKPEALHLEHAGGGLLALDILGLVLGGQIEAAAGPRVQILKGLVLVLPIDEVLGGDAVVKALDFRPDDD